MTQETRCLDLCGGRLNLQALEIIAKELQQHGSLVIKNCHQGLNQTLVEMWAELAEEYRRRTSIDLMKPLKVYEPQI